MGLEPTTYGLGKQEAFLTRYENCGVDRAIVISSIATNTVSGFTATMSAIEVVKDGAPCLGITFLTCKAANGPGNHAVDYRLVIVGIGPPGTCAIPGHSRRIVRPSDSAGDDAPGNS